MGFTGDLNKLPLGDVFTSCHQNSMTGALAVRDRKGERLISWEKGYVTGCAGVEAGDESLAGEMVRRRVVGEDQIGRPSRFFKRKGSLKRSLKRRNVLNSGEFNNFARSVVLERIYDCFLLEEGTFEFLEKYDKTRFDDDEESAEVRISPNEILMEAMRRVDEWSRIRRSIPSFREVYVATRQPSDEDIPLHREILVMTSSGTLDLEGVLDSSPAPRFACCEAILVLVEAGAVRVATVPEYLELGTKAEEADDLESAASFYARGLSYERGNQMLNERRISVLERLERNSEAADERKLFAGTLLEKGDREGAGRQYAQAAELVPTDPLPLERLLDLKVQDKNYEQAKLTGDKLVKLYLRLGLADSAKKVFPRLLLLKPKDPWLRERMAETHAELHEKGTAAGIYKELAQEHLKEEENAAALDLLQKALKLQPEDKKTKQLVKDLESGEHKIKRRRRRIFTALMALGTLLTITIGWGTYEALAMGYLRKVGENVVLEQGCDGLLNSINALEFRNERDGREIYRWTVASRWSREIAESLAKLYLREAEFSGETFQLAPPPDEGGLTSQQVKEQLSPILAPPQEPSLSSLIAQAEDLLTEGKREEASHLLEQILKRVEDAKLVMSQSGPAARSFHAFGREVRGLLPRIYMALGRARIRVLEARRILDEAAQPISVPEPDGAGNSKK